MPGTYLYPEEIVLRGPEALADDLVTMGVETAIVSILYHPSRRVFPRYQRISCSGAGQLAITPRSSYGGFAWHGRHDPDIASGVIAFRRACRERNLAFRAWMVMMHQMPQLMGLESLGATYVDGTASEHALCPSNPGTVSLAGELVRHVAETLDPDGFDLEAPLHSDWEPDYSLSLTTSPGSAAQAVCVCPHCQDTMTEVGLDPAGAIEQLASIAWHTGSMLPAEVHGRFRAARALGPTRLATALAAHTTSPRALLSGKPDSLVDRGWSDPTSALYEQLVLGVMDLSGELLKQEWAALAGLPGDAKVASTNWMPHRAGRAFQEDVAWLLSVGAGVSVYNHSLLPAEALADLQAACRKGGTS